MSIFGSVFKLVKGAVGGFISGGPIGAVTGGIKAVIPKPATLPPYENTGYVGAQTGGYGPQAWPSNIPPVFAGSTGGSPVNTYAPPAVAPHVQPHKRPKQAAETVKRVRAIARSARTVVKQVRNVRVRKLKFGSPAWRAKYMKPRKRKAA